MVGTCVYSVDDDPTVSERREKKGVDNHDVGLGGLPSANASLIGNDDQCSTGRLGGGRCIQGEVERLEIARLDDVAVDDTPIQNPVAVQEQRRPSRRTSFTPYVTDHELPPVPTKQRIGGVAWLSDHLGATAHPARMTSRSQLTPVAVTPSPRTQSGRLHTFRLNTLDTGGSAISHPSAGWLRTERCVGPLGIRPLRYHVTAQSNLSEEIRVTISVSIPTVWVVVAHTDFRHGLLHGVTQSDRILDSGKNRAAVVFTRLLECRNLCGDEGKPGSHRQVDRARGRGTAIRSNYDVGLLEQGSNLVIRYIPRNDLMVVLASVSDDSQCRLCVSPRFPGNREMSTLSVTYERGECFCEFIDALVRANNTEEEKSHRIVFAAQPARWNAAHWVRRARGVLETPRRSAVAEGEDRIDAPYRCRISNEPRHRQLTGLKDASAIGNTSLQVGALPLRRQSIRAFPLPLARRSAGLLTLPPGSYAQ